MRPLYDELLDRGLLEYGQFIPGDLVRELLDLVMPDVATKREFDAISLRELSAADEVRAILLNEGKYLSGAGNGYRILTPGENKGQVDRYLANAQNKIRRARKLERTSPQMIGQAPSQLKARMMLAMKGMGSRWDQSEDQAEDPANDQAEQPAT